MSFITIFHYNVHGNVYHNGGKMADGISLFAAFYILAQVIERITEPVSWIFDYKGWKDNKKIGGLWLIASFFGIVLCWFLNIGLLKTIGIIIPDSSDYILSGIVIGSGTKPLHDIIAYIENKTP